MTTYARVAAVTGANKGIGLAIVRNLALQYPGSALNTGPLLIYLTARDTSRGQTALDALQKDDQLLKAKVLAAQGGPVSLAFKQLDISSPASIDAFAADLARTHGQIDVVINNAGIALEGFNTDVVQRTLATNYHGTIHATLTLLPLLRPSPLSRLVNVASTAGALTKYAPDLRARFRAAGTGAGATTATAAVAAVEAHGAAAEGRAARGVYSCCPGWVATDMTKGRGTKSVDEGAGTPVMLAVGDLGGRGGGAFWEGGEVREW